LIVWPTLFNHLPGFHLINEESIRHFSLWELQTDLKGFNFKLHMIGHFLVICHWATGIVHRYLYTLIPDNESIRTDGLLKDRHSVL